VPVATTAGTEETPEKLWHRVGLDRAIFLEDTFDRHFSQRDVRRPFVAVSTNRWRASLPRQRFQADRCWYPKGP